jgi:hypothetical protein
MLCSVGPAHRGSCCPRACSQGPPGALGERQRSRRSRRAHPSTPWMWRPPAGVAAACDGAAVVHHCLQPLQPLVAGDPRPQPQRRRGPRSRRREARCRRQPVHVPADRGPDQRGHQFGPPAVPPGSRGRPGAEGIGALGSGWAGGPAVEGEEHSYFGASVGPGNDRVAFGESFDEL